MANFYDFINRVNETQNDKMDEFLLSFFSGSNRKNYEMFEGYSNDDKKAVDILFNSKKDLLERCELAFEYNPFCLEAFFLYSILQEDIYSILRFKSYYEKLDCYGDLSFYNQKTFVIILCLYVEFELRVGNITNAIKVQKMIMRLTNDDSLESVTSLVDMYSALENVDEIYRLYCHYDFDAHCYLILLINLLKHDDTFKAKQVLLEMFDKIAYSSYLDHLWDLDEEDEKQQSFYREVDRVYEEMTAVPDFFVFISEIKEQNEKS